VQPDRPGGTGSTVVVQLDKTGGKGNKIAVQPGRTSGTVQVVGLRCSQVGLMA
jgi:hypothetical protein